MSLTIQQILSDAKKLATRLKEHDSAADVLLSQAQSVFKQIDAMKQYQEEVGEMNDVAKHRPHGALVAGIQQENRHLRELQQENRELRSALEEHQNALELIMSKYRQHVMQLVKSRSDSEMTNPYDYNTYSQVLQERADKICEMAAIMNHAIHMDDEALQKEEELLARLVTENKGLRELLEISCRYGSFRSKLMGVDLEDKEVQTDPTSPSPS